MFRVEIIGNQVLLQDLLDAVEQKLPQQCYTVLPVLRAKGREEKANGDDVWMERNFVCLMFVDNTEDTVEITRICDVMRSQNTMNALIMFTSRVVSTTDNQ